MLVSVIIPAYNCKHTIKQAVESILNQTHQQIEILIIDDNPDDDRSIENIYKKTYAHLSHVNYYKNNPSEQKWNKKGINIDAGYSARNLGLLNASGDWITFQDADDYSLLNRIEIQLALAEQYNLNHVITDYIWASPNYYLKKLNYMNFITSRKIEVIKKKDIVQTSRKALGIMTRLLPSTIFSIIPFKFKSSRLTRALFIKNEKGFPGAANSPLISRELVKECKFRSLNLREWPTFRGRGADRDFNFQVVNLDKAKTMSFKIPLYCWKTPKYFEKYEGIDSFIND